MFLWLYTGMLPVVTKYLQMSTQRDTTDIIFNVFLLLLFIPEILGLVSRGIRHWIVGELHSNGQGFLAFYAGLWCIRITVYFSVMMTLYDKEVPFPHYISTLIAGFGISSLPILGRIMKSKQ